jgi:hypothetical protein
VLVRNGAGNGCIFVKDANEFDAIHFFPKLRMDAAQMSNACHTDLESSHSGIETAK